jgi:hypothetical protein
MILFPESDKQSCQCTLVPDNLQAQIYSHPATKLATRVRTQADKIYNELYADFQCEEYPEECAEEYSANACNALVKLLPDVDGLSTMPGGIEAAYDLMLHLGRRTFFGVKEHWSAEKSVPLSKGTRFYDPADRMLYDFATKMKEKRSNFHPRKEFDELVTQRRVLLIKPKSTIGNQQWEGLYVHGDIDGSSPSSRDGYLARSHEFIWSCVVGQAGVEAYAKELEGSIRREYVKICRNATTFTSTLEQLSKAMDKYMSAIRRLKYMHGGLKPALDLTIFLDKKTIPPADLPTGNTTDRRSLDSAIDKLHVQLYTSLEQGSPGSMSALIYLNALRINSKTLEERNINEYLPKFRALLAERLCNETSKPSNSQSSISDLKHDRVPKRKKAIKDFGR